VLILGDRRVLLGRRVHAQELPGPAHLAQEAVGAAVASGDAHADAGGAGTLHQLLLIVGRRTERRGERGAQRRRLRDDGHIAGLQGQLTLTGEVPDLVPQQLGELHRMKPPVK